MLAQPLTATLLTPESTQGAGRTFANRTPPIGHTPITDKALYKVKQTPRISGDNRLPATSTCRLRTPTDGNTKNTTVNPRRRSNLGLPHINYEPQTQSVSLAPASTCDFSTTAGSNTSDTRVNAKPRSNLCTPHITYEPQARNVSENQQLANTNI